MYSILSRNPRCVPTNPGPILVYYGPGTPIVNANSSPVVDKLKNLAFQANPMVDCATQATIGVHFV